MTDTRSLTERLRNPLMVVASAGNYSTSYAVMEEHAARRDMTEAADVIEQLRALVEAFGVVSQGNGSFREVTKDLPRAAASTHPTWWV